MADDGPGTLRVDAVELRRFSTALLRSTGLGVDASAAAADVLTRTTMRGVQSHGLHALPQYLRQLREGGANPDARPRRADGGSGHAVAVLDADAGLGPAVAHYATLEAIELARAFGVGAVAVRNANHFGAAGHYALMFAEAACVGLAMSNTPPIMAVTGSTTRTIGNSPLGFGAPRTDGPPLVLDIAMSRVAGGKIRLALQRGEEIPIGWALGPTGRPTTDPADFLQGLGALLPMEGHKGYGLALMVETLAGALSGAAMLSQVSNWLYAPETPSGTGYFLVAIDVGSDSVFADVPARVEAMCAEVGSAPRARGVEQILIPGEPEDASERDALARGVAIPREIWASLQDAAAHTGVVAPGPPV